MNIFLKIYYVYFSKFGFIYNKINLLISYLLNFKEIKSRNELYLNEISKIKNNKIDKIVSKLNTDGYYFTNLKEFNINFDISKKIKSLDTVPGNKSKKKFFTNLYEFRKNDDLSTFAINKYFIKLISKYLKLSPIINNIQLIKSDIINDKQFYSSMNWHIDNHHDKLIKIMLLPFDLDIQGGPTCFLDKKTSEYIIKKNFYFKSPRYFSDSEIKEIKSNFKKKIKSFTGKKNDILLIDTSKCLHMGSRCNAERYQLFVTYTPIQTNDLNTLKSLKKFEFLNKKIKDLYFT